MKTFFTLAFALVLTGVHAQVTISTQGNNTFSPATATIDAGEVVTFNIQGIHTATQVSEETWMANGITQLDGGFHFTAGTHEITPIGPDTIYFVCQPHASMGMKGMIIVELSIGMQEQASSSLFRMFPNPVSDEMTVEMAGNTSELVLIDIQGREVMRRMVSANERVNIAHLIEGNYTAILRGADGSTIGTQRITIKR